MKKSGLICKNILNTLFSYMEIQISEMKISIDRNKGNVVQYYHQKMHKSMQDTERTKKETHEILLFREKCIGGYMVFLEKI